MPTEPTPNPAHEDHAAHDRRPSDDVDRDPLAPSTGPSLAPSTAASPTRRVYAGQAALSNDERARR
ncbi:hypothetical protein, partial [Streptomyces cinereoruber]|uniref:hypothetical protein n=1 Tax=Streptomyces cinereoruber TaxID=67260 RepID=UPI00362C0F58